MNQLGSARPMPSQPPEFPAYRDYDRLLIITRSGTTTEVLRLLEDYQGKIPTVSIIADPNTPSRTV